MSSINRLVEKNIDPKAQAIENNPCSICRAMGMPVCKGHGGGASGGSSSSTDEPLAVSKDLAPSHNLKLTADLGVLISQNGNWGSSDLSESVFHFESPNALLGLHLDMERGLISFYGNKNLSKEQSIILDKFFNIIENELGFFKKELTEQGANDAIIDQITIDRQHNSLTLKFPSPKFYDAFVKRLVDKNLLPVASIPQDKKAIVAPRSMLPEVEAEQVYSRSTTPTPFDISQLKPKA